MSRGLILGIETSCDETAAAVVERGSRTLSSVVASQIATHARYGGVVPELASREHLRAIAPVVRAALAEANVTLADLDAIAVTSGPGLAGALLVGITYAKALAFANHLPLIAVNHLEGHIHAVLLNERESAAADYSTPDGHLVSDRHPDSDGHPERVPSAAKDESKDPHFALEPGAPPKLRLGGIAQISTIHSSIDTNPGAPGPESGTGDSKNLALSSALGSAPGPSHSGTWDTTTPDAAQSLALVVSGGHTHLYLARPANGTWHYTLIGRTVDDAAGEAFDKVAKLLGLGYPGGPWIDSLARFGNPHAVPFAFAQFKPKAHLAGKAPPRTKAAKTAPIARLDPHFLFSFSGIKTAVLRYVELHGMRAEAQARTSRLFDVAPSFPQAAPADAERVRARVCNPGDQNTPEKAAPNTHDISRRGKIPSHASFVSGHEFTGAAMEGFVSGHEFTRAATDANQIGALAPEETPSQSPPQTPGAPGLDFETWETSKAGSLTIRLPKTREEALALCPQPTLDLVASFQHAVIGDLMKKTFAAAESLGVKRILITGGVAANRELRQRFSREAATRGIGIAFPTLALSTDNAAMIAAAAWPRFLAHEFAPDNLSADPSLTLG